MKKQPITWEILSKSHVGKNGHSYWLCRCSKCGREVVASSYNLKRGYPVCECSLTRRKQHFNSLSKNQFETIGGLTFMYDLDGNSTIIDAEDIPRISTHYWRKQKDEYWCSQGRIYLHRFIMNCPDDLVVDHIDHNHSNHQKENLRICTHQENQFNKQPKKRKIDLPQGIYPTPYGKYRASLRIKQVKLHKNFDTLEEAVAQRKAWEDEYIGNFIYKK